MIVPGKIVCQLYWIFLTYLTFIIKNKFHICVSPDSFTPSLKVLRLWPFCPSVFALLCLLSCVSLPQRSDQEALSLHCPRWHSGEWIKKTWPLSFPSFRALALTVLSDSSSSIMCPVVLRPKSMGLLRRATNLPLTCKPKFWGKGTLALYLNYSHDCATLWIGQVNSHLWVWVFLSIH